MNELPSNAASAFSALYDRYASVILGVIKRIVEDEQDAIRLLEVTFVKGRSQISEFQPARQPLFTRLLTIARHTALDALKARKAVHSPVVQLTSSGKVFIPDQNNTTSKSCASTRPVDFRLKELLDTVLFKNCTPEEASATLGLPVDLARQQLRLAVQQLRASQMNQLE